jgi:hypothetical protein
MTRGHAKDSGSGGNMNTGQIMLVFESPGLIEYSVESAEHNAEAAFSDEERREITDLFSRFDAKVKIAGNDPIARIPVQHVYIKCGPLRKRRDNSSTCALDVVVQHLTEVNMVRVSLNPPPELWGIIPKWLEKRTRHEREELKKSISALSSRL